MQRTILWLKKESEMKFPKWALALLLVVFVIHWLVPLRMIFGSEEVVTEGKMFKFRTRPVDPTDPFRGKYVTLSFSENSFVVDSSETWESGEDIYVQLGEDSLGFAVIEAVSKFGMGSEIVKAKVAYYSMGEVHINYPFDRFYMEETKAPVAENIYWEAIRDTSKITWAEVMVKDGKAVLTDVKIGGVSLKELAEEQ